MHIRVSHVARALAFIALAGFMSTANAAKDDGWYLGAGLGLIDYGDDGTLRYDEATFAAKEEDSGDDTSVSVWAGYRFNRYLSIEAGYMRNDSTELVLRDAANDVAGVFEFRTEGATLVVVGALPLGKWEPYARAGVLIADTEARVIADNAVISSENETSPEFIGALGLAYSFTAHWQAKADAACAVEAGERTGTGESTVYVLTVGFTYRF
jgi:hypothetical protein